MAITKHKLATREQWLEARKELLEREKELTRRSDELARQRLELPWVPVDKPYSFETGEGTKTLAQLFKGRSQLLVYHFMFGPDWDEGCPSCTLSADGFDGQMIHLNHRDVTMVSVSRAPLERLDAYKRRMGWEFDWVSSLGSDFNFDFGVSFTGEQRENGVHYNFEPIGDPGIDELPGMRFRSGGRRRLPHLLRLRAWRRRADGDLPAARRAPKGRNEGGLSFPMECAAQGRVRRRRLGGDHVTPIAHISGVPVEELLPVLFTTAGLWACVRALIAKVGR